MLRILHLDRSQLFRKVMRDLVYSCGHQAVCSATRAEAWPLLAEGGIDLIVTGLELDDGKGEDFIRELSERDEYRSIPVIVVTSTDAIEMRERLFSMGVVDYILKGGLDEDRLRRYFDALAAEDELSSFMRSLSVAVLDDSPVILKVVSGILSLNGFSSVRCFSHPADLVACPDRFDLYITDIVLPGMSGEEVVSRIRRSGADGIIICISQFTSEGALSTVLQAGADDYIPKPFDAVVLISRIKVNARSYLLKKRLERMAVTDGLTGLYNHRYSHERLAEEVAKASRYGRPLSFLITDIDDFKKVNDTYGHRAGDEVLAGVARIVKERLRSVDIVGRYGGEEFVAILPETPLRAARIAAEKIRAAVSEAAFLSGSLSVTISGGVAELAPEESSDGLVVRADGYLYTAKRSGKNRIES